MMMRADPRRAIGAAMLLLAVWPLSAGAQEMPAPQEDAQQVTFDAALARIDATSPGLAGEEHSVRASELLADATRTLRRPTVTASASLIEYQKTLSVDITA